MPSAGASSIGGFTTGAYACAHFVVDLACVATMLHVVAPTLGAAYVGGRVLAIVAYDMAAFCLQLPVGALLDVAGARRWRPAALVSCGLVACGVLAGRTRIVPFAALSLACVAVGNALFHCAGGEEVLAESAGAAAPSGVFISTGALGVFLGGTGLGEASFAPALLVGLLAGASYLLAVAPWVAARERLFEKRGFSVKLSAAGWAAVLLLATCVALRSYVGMAMAFPWKADVALSVCAVLAVVAGKAVGGFVSDRLGALAASVVSLGGAAPLFLWAWESPVAGIAATFLFNFTMAITLCALAALLPRAQGLAFGIASFALAVGAVPALTGFSVTGPVVLCALSVASLAALTAGLLVGARCT